MQFRVIRVTDPQTHKHTPHARPPQTHRQDRLQYTAPQLASAQCNELHIMAIEAVCMSALT